ncbi:IS110 family transposase, partial [Cupriavidus necator]
MRTNKTDAADARAIWTAAQQPGMRPIPVKTEAQQALLGLHRIRSELVDSRTRQVNQIRGLLGEYGLHFVLGRKAAMAQFVTRLSEIEQTIPAPL